MEYYSAIKKNTFESVLMRWMQLEPIIQSEVSQKEKHHLGSDVRCCFFLISLLPALASPLQTLQTSPHLQTSPPARRPAITCNKVSPNGCAWLQ